MTTIPFANFTKGELAPELQARIDTSQYTAGAKKVRNFIVQRYGGLSFRPGFRFVGEADSPTKQVRYLPFQYNIEQAYVLVLEDTTMRFMLNGGFVTEEDLKITAISKAVNATVTSPYHGYAVGDRIYYDSVVGMTELNGRTATVVTVPNTSTYTININTTTYGTFVSADGVTRSASPDPLPAPPAPPAIPPAEPVPPRTTVGGGSGTNMGIEKGWSYSFLNFNSFDREP